jgi:hypothetical protein
MSKMIGNFLKANNNFIYLFIYKIFIKKTPKNDGEGNKPIVQSKAHGGGNIPLLVCKGWITRYSALLVVLPLHLSPPFFVVLVLLFHSST